ncbi:MAG: hypothetical protein LBF58_06625 [Deltaproteobacteria bacterium]|jgi:transposase|nr:hypothetical protein [Deltaproteobacteria bacterium]
MKDITIKTVYGIDYYYYEETELIDGKPTVVRKKRLGAVEDLAAKIKVPAMLSRKEELFSEEFEFGAVALMYDLAKKLNLVDIIDRHATNVRTGPSVGSYMVAVAIYLAVAPSSSGDPQEWFEKTCLPLMTGIGGFRFSLQNFWAKASKIDRDTLRATLLGRVPVDSIWSIDEDILSRVKDIYDIDVSNVICCPTNSFAYVGGRDDGKLTAPGGHMPQEKKPHVETFYIEVSTDYCIPITHNGDPGATNYAEELALHVDSRQRYCKPIVGKTNTVLLVLDRENFCGDDDIRVLVSGNALKNIPAAEKDIYHYLGLLRKSQAESLWAVPKGEYVPLIGDRFTGLSAYRMEVEFFGQRLTGLIFNDPGLKERQIEEIKINVEKAKAKLQDLEEALTRRAKGGDAEGTEPTVESVGECVENILKDEYVKDILKCDIFEKNKNVLLKYSTSEQSLELISRDILGKTALYTNRHDYSNEEIVAAYLTARHVGQEFARMADTKRLKPRQKFRWTDKRIKLHIFTCVLAYRLRALLIKDLATQGIDIGIDQLISEMSEVKAVETVYGGKERPEVVATLTGGSELAQRLVELYRLREKYLGHTL